MRSFNVLYIVLSILIASSAFAANGVLPGSGTENDPYLIEDRADFFYYCWCSEYQLADVYTKQLCDIDLADSPFNNCCFQGNYSSATSTVPNAYQFSGIYDGNNKTISGLTVNAGYFYGSAIGGLVGHLTSTGVLKNIIIKDAYVQSTYYERYNALLCGNNNGTIVNCHVTGQVAANDTLSVGLLAGINQDGGIIRHCSAMGRVLHNSGWDSGGICANNLSIISDSYADVDIVAVNTRYAGSFCGYTHNFNNLNNISITNCYAKGSVTADEVVGGFCGKNSWMLSNCYSSAQVHSLSGQEAGFCYEYDSDLTSCVSSCVWDNDLASSPDYSYDPLLLYLTMDDIVNETAENHGTLDYSSAVNGTPAIVAGISGNCLEFDGASDYLEFDDYNGIYYNMPRTISTWIKTSATNRQVITGWGKRVSGKIWQLNIEPDGHLRQLVGGGYKQSSLVVNDGQWHHVAVVLPFGDPATVADIKIYIDGVCDTNSIASSEQEISTGILGKMTIGMNYIDDTANNFFNGCIDEFRLYNGALSDTDIAGLAVLLEPNVQVVVSGKSALEMQDINTYLSAGWDITASDSGSNSSTWVISDSSFPEFSWSKPRNDTVFFDRKNLKGITCDEAVALLADSGITANIIYDCSRIIPADTVITSEADSVILRNATELNVIVSSGPYDWSTNPGTGTAIDPYQITTPGMLFGLPIDKFYHFKLMNDIDLVSYYFSNGSVIRSDYTSGNTFRGVFDGNGHVIRNANIYGFCSYNVYSLNIPGYYHVDGKCAGLFSVIWDENSVVENLGLENITISGDADLTGGFVGVCDSARIQNCYVNGGKIFASASIATNILGGFAGYGVNIKSCYASLSLECRITSYNDTLYCGGFVGIGSKIANCYSNSKLYVGSSMKYYPGGFTGIVASDYSITNCYSSSKFIFAGADDVLNNGFIGTSGGQYVHSVNSCFWDCEISNIGQADVTNRGATAKTTAQMHDVNTYLNAGWDFTDESSNGTNDYWYLDPESTYPKLVWQSVKPAVYASSLIGNTKQYVIDTLTDIGVAATVKYDYDPDYPVGTVFLIDGPDYLQQGTQAKVLVSLGSYNWADNPGDGTQARPWQLSTVGMFRAMKYPQYSGYSIVMNDIDFSGYTFERHVIGMVDGDLTDFTGNFDGNHKLLSNINIVSNNYRTLGFFGINTGNISNCVIDNIQLQLDCNVLNTIFAGSFVYMNSGTVSSCSVISCSVNTYGFTDYGLNVSVGGFCSNNSGSISKCSVGIDINLSCQVYRDCVAGFVAQNYSGIITKSYSDIDIEVYSNSSNSLIISGFVGDYYGSTIYDCYAQGSITTDNADTVYLFGAYRYVERSYAAVSVDITGSAEVTIAYNDNESQSFWDNQLCPVSDYPFGYQTIALSTAQLCDINTYSNTDWDFSSSDGTPPVWQILGNNYPTLVWQGTPDTDNSGCVDLLDMAKIAQNWLSTDPLKSSLDFDQSGQIDLVDLEIFSELWLEKFLISNLVAYWPLDNADDGIVNDSSDYSHNGSIFGAPIITTGVNDSCFDFDGSNDYIYVESFGGIAGASPRTIAAYIKAESDLENQENNLHAIVSWGDFDRYEKWFVTLDSATGQLALGISGTRLMGGPDLEDGQWHHIAVVLPENADNINEVLLYVDGQLVTSNAGSLNAVINTDYTEVIIGATNRASQGEARDMAQFFDGSIDDLCIYNKALSPEQITELCQMNIVQ